MLFSGWVSTTGIIAASACRSAWASRAGSESGSLRLVQAHWGSLYYYDAQQTGQSLTFHSPTCSWRILWYGQTSDISTRLETHLQLVSIAWALAPSQPPTILLWGADDLRNVLSCLHCLQLWSSENRVCRRSLCRIDISLIVTSIIRYRHHLLRYKAWDIW